MILGELVRKRIFKNCLEVRKTSEGIVPVRFTQKQLDEYAKNPNHRIRSFCPTGVCLDFRTDSDILKIDYAVGGFARAWLHFDVFINDIFVQTIGTRPDAEDCGSLCISIPKGKMGLTRVTVYLPHTIELIIKNIEFSELAVVEEVGSYEKNILCLGDSITQGMEAFRPSSTYPVLLSRFLEMNLLNQGVGGYIFDVKSFDSDLPFEPDIITVAYGTNDWGRYKSLSEFEDKCFNYINALSTRYSNSLIYVITPCWRKDLDEVKESGTFYDISNSIVNVCKAYTNIKIIDGLKLIPHFEHFFGDARLHPSDEGFLHMALNILAKIVKN